LQVDEIILSNIISKHYLRLFTISSFLML